MHGPEQSSDGGSRRARRRGRAAGDREATVQARGEQAVAEQPPGGVEGRRRARCGESRGRWRARQRKRARRILARGRIARDRRCRRDGRGRVGGSRVGWAGGLRRGNRQHADGCHRCARRGHGGGAAAAARPPGAAVLLAPSALRSGPGRRCRRRNLRDGRRGISRRHRRIRSRRHVRRGRFGRRGLRGRVRRRRRRGRRRVRDGFRWGRPGLGGSRGRRRDRVGRGCGVRRVVRRRSSVVRRRVGGALGCGRIGRAGAGRGALRRGRRRDRVGAVRRGGGRRRRLIVRTSRPGEDGHAPERKQESGGVAESPQRPAPSMARPAASDNSDQARLQRRSPLRLPGVSQVRAATQPPGFALVSQVRLE